MRTTTIIIISTKELWGKAKQTGIYTHSTIDSSLEDVGFIHCSFSNQTIEIANRHFANQDNLVLLLIDKNKVKSPVKLEGALSGRAGIFPHIYGPLNVDAVYQIIPLEKDNEGKFLEPKELKTLQED